MDAPNSAASSLEPEPGSRPVSETGICNNLLSASDIPFGTAVFAITTACPSQRRGLPPEANTPVADVRREAPGKYCVSGALASASASYAILIVSFDHINDTPAPPFHGPLDAQALGIRQVRFTLESLPASGVRVSASSVVRDECPFESDECIQGGMYLRGEGGVPSLITQSSTYTPLLADFKPDDGSALSLDTTRLAGIQFEIMPGAFDFCVSDVQLLDDAGAAVSPP